MQLEGKDGKWTGKSVASAEEVPEAAVSEVAVTGDLIHFLLKVQGQKFRFEGKVPQRMPRSCSALFAIGRQTVPVELERTDLKTLDAYEVSKEVVAKQAGGPDVIDAATKLLLQAAAKKAKPEEVRSWADKAAKAAEATGHASSAMSILASPPSSRSRTASPPSPWSTPARRERRSTPKDRAGVQKQVLDVLSEALTKAGKADEAKAVAGRITKLDAQVKPEPFAGRKGRATASRSWSCSPAPSARRASPPTGLRRPGQDVQAGGGGSVAVSPARPRPRPAHQS